MPNNGIGRPAAEIIIITEEGDTSGGIHDVFIYYIRITVLILKKRPFFKKFSRSFSTLIIRDHGCVYILYRYKFATTVFRGKYIRMYNNILTGNGRDRRRWKKSGNKYPVGKIISNGYTVYNIIMYDDDDRDLKSTLYNKNVYVIFRFRF